MASYHLRDYKNATPIFRYLADTDGKNELYKRWLTNSVYGEKLWLINSINVVCGLMVLASILFKNQIPALIGFPMTAIGVTGLAILWIYNYYVRRSFRKTLNRP